MSPMVEVYRASHGVRGGLLSVCSAADLHILLPRERWMKADDGQLRSCSDRFQLREPRPAERA